MISVRRNTAGGLPRRINRMSKDMKIKKHKVCQLRASDLPLLEFKMHSGGGGWGCLGEAAGRHKLVTTIY